MNKLKYLNLFLLTLFFSTDCFSRDTLDIPTHKAGAMMIYEFAKGNLATEFKYGTGMGAFYERRLGKRFVFTTDLSLRLRDFKKEHIDYGFGPSNGTRNIYESSWKLTTISSGIGIKFFYFKKQKLYLEIGGGFEYRFTESPEPKYKTSRTYVAGKAVDEYFEEYTLAPYRSNLVILSTKIYGRVDLGLGIQIKKIDIGILYKRDLIDTLGLRLKYSFL